MKTENEQKTRSDAVQARNLIQWLSSKKSADYFGRAFAIRAGVLAHLITGDSSLAEIGRTHGVSRQAVHKHAVKARAIYFEPTTGG